LLHALSLIVTETQRRLSALLRAEFDYISRESYRRREMCSGRGRLCVCVCVSLSLAAIPHCCADPDVTWGDGRDAL